MKSIDEIYRDFPDEEREKKSLAAGARPGSGPVCRARLGVLLLPVFVLLSFGLLSLPPTCRHFRVREATARTLLRELDRQAQEYRERFGTFPEGDGKGCRGLIEGLERLYDGSVRLRGVGSGPPSPKDEDREVSNPLYQGCPGPLGLVHYRFPGQHRPGSFDLWAADAQGREDGLNNWEPGR
jgi:hypothetical protein